MKNTLQSEARLDAYKGGRDEPPAGVASNVHRRLSNAVRLLFVLSLLLAVGGAAGLAVGLWSTSATAETERVVTDVCDTGVETSGMSSGAIVGCARPAASFASNDAPRADLEDPSSWSSLVTSVRLTVPFPRLVVGGVARVLG